MGQPTDHPVDEQPAPPDYQPDTGDAADGDHHLPPEPYVEPKGAHRG